MQFFAPLVVLAGLASGTFADVACSGPNARTQPPVGAVVVDATGAHPGSYKTVSEGVANVVNDTAEHTLFMFPGVYREQVIVPKFNGPLVLQGYTCNTLSYADNQVTITNSMTQKDLPANATGSANQLVSTMLFKSKNGTKVYNLNVANPQVKIKSGGQAPAVFVNAANHGFYACNMTGYQDTLCANRGPQLYAKSYINGAVDFIFGLLSKSWFESCDLESIGNGSITANGNGDSSNLSEYVINNARVFGHFNKSSAYLGRPWYPYARVVFQNSELGDVVSPKGWNQWNKGNDTANVYFKEFNNRGPGAGIGQRVQFSGQLDAAVPITDILGDDYKSQWYVDTKFL
ncbi:hypothetical protein PR003_g29583 [Phytophthora rubi]|uniref:Pectinesterase n=1 Tax=Phytophthora rubi TaxID=129364 RepID=A0A6A3H6H0_9STRA|nr:hypothetical protein PR001_g29006 [Phytophthora rubi]KAE9274519.1 hypothetical protein PR003_g29583 [Phytophthora rubi]